MNQTTLMAIAFVFVLDVFRKYETCGTAESAVQELRHRSGVTTTSKNSQTGKGTKVAKGGHE
jgi:hypothetical protein